MRVVFRVDASIQMGTGHVMRCLTLAQALKENGVGARFICRKHKGNLIDKIRSSGFNVHELEAFEKAEIDNKLAHSHWLGATQKQDADDCIDILKSEKFDCLIVDHYALDDWWQKKLKPCYEKLVVIDDLADRKHQCDILIDQTYGRQKKNYKGLVPKSCKLLLGSQYALLRPEFSKWREYSLKRRSNPVPKNLFINMGGSDPNNITEQVLSEIEACQLPNDVEVTVVMGSTSPHLQRIMAIASNLAYRVEVRVDIDNMAEVMANSDIAIGATGSTTWERCCLGLPAIQIIIADNQIEIANSLDEVHAIKLIKKINQLSLAMKDMLLSLDKMSLVSSVIVDGQGVNKVVQHIISNIFSVSNLSLKPAVYGDYNFIYDLQTVDDRKYYINTKAPSMDEHIKWIKKILSSKESQLFVATIKKHSVGLLRVDNLNTKVIEISIIISASHRGQSLAKRILIMLEDIVFDRKLKATIHINNIASIMTFKSVGFHKCSQNNDFAEYIKIV